MIPALRDWTPSSGSYTFTTSSRIVLDTRHARELAGTAAILSGDLAVTAGHTVPVVTASTPKLGDLFLTIDDRQGAEQYRMTIGDRVRITGGNPTGVFYGTRTVLQLVHQNATIPAGTAVDGPSYPERGLMIDVGRKFFTVGWLRKHVRELAYLKLNYLHLHLSDDQGFRVESTSHPEVVSAKHYTNRRSAI